MDKGYYETFRLINDTKVSIRILWALFIMGVIAKAGSAGNHESRNGGKYGYRISQIIKNISSV